MIDGCVREIKRHEYRVGLTPDNVHAYTARGHKVLIEKGAGEGSGFDWPGPTRDLRWVLTSIRALLPAKKRRKAWESPGLRGSNYFLFMEKTALD
jgi:hypothetical protein